MPSKRHHNSQSKNFPLESQCSASVARGHPGAGRSPHLGCGCSAWRGRGGKAGAQAQDAEEGVPLASVKEQHLSPCQLCSQLLTVATAIDLRDQTRPPRSSGSGPRQFVWESPWTSPAPLGDRFPRPAAEGVPTLTPTCCVLCHPLSLPFLPAIGGCSWLPFSAARLLHLRELLVVSLRDSPQPVRALRLCHQTPQLPAAPKLLRLQRC